LSNSKLQLQTGQVLEFFLKEDFNAKIVAKTQVCFGFGTSLLISFNFNKIDCFLYCKWSFLKK